MKLHEHEDFEQAIIRTGNYFKEAGIRNALIEKDYYVTEALRVIADKFKDQFIFKGGTSLSKGWNLIHRFSEDIDLLLIPLDLSKNAIDRKLIELRDAVEDSTPLKYINEGGFTTRGCARKDYFSFEQIFSATGEVPNTIMLESGVRGGVVPTETVALQSYIGEYLHETKTTLKTENEGKFELVLLHFRRTFVEKLFTIHKIIERYKAGDTQIGPHARHYYDLYQLAEKNEVIEMLRTSEYAEIKEDYEQITMEHFADQYHCPKDKSFANSDAIFPTDPLSKEIQKDYEIQCRTLCYGEFPSWDKVLDRFNQIRYLL